jgi:glycerophosphoryl diester phosphodiesterase
MRVPLPAAFLTHPLAHRALHDITQGRPENSRAAVQAAINLGYGIEIDVQLSADAQAMVFHDDELPRLTGRPGPLIAHTTAALGNIPLLGGAEGIPTLPEILTLIAGRVPLLIEIKDQHGQMGQTDGRLERATLAALSAYVGPVAVMSFNPHSVAHLARLLPHVPRGLTTDAFDPQDWAPVPPAVCDSLRAIPDYDRVQASFLSHDWHDLARPRVAELARQGAAILCWTVKSPADEVQARKIAQNITFERFLARFPA